MKELAKNYDPSILITNFIKPLFICQHFFSLYFSCDCYGYDGNFIKYFKVSKRDRIKKFNEKLYEQNKFSLFKKT